MRLISAVMGTQSMKAREDANAALLNYGFNFYETKQVFAAGQPMTTVHVWKGAAPEVGLTLQRDLFVTNQRGQLSNVKAEFAVPDVVVAPLARNRPVGKAKILVNGAVAATCDLFPAQDVPAGGLFRRAWDTIRLWFH
jgi:D-alanyl-D-alanine carboxypeptidase (penicillin-binding protein 5/6)